MLNPAKTKIHRKSRSSRLHCNGRPLTEFKATDRVLGAVLDICMLIPAKTHIHRKSGSSRLRLMGGHWQSAWRRRHRHRRGLSSCLTAGRECHVPFYPQNLRVPCATCAIEQMISNLHRNCKGLSLCQTGPWDRHVSAAISQDGYSPKNLSNFWYESALT